MPKYMPEGGESFCGWGSSLPDPEGAWDVVDERQVGCELAIVRGQ